LLFSIFLFYFFSHKPFHLAQDLYIFYLFLPLYHTNIYNYLLAVQCFLSRFSFRDKTPNQRCSAFCLVFLFGTKLPISGAVLFVSFFFSGQNTLSAARHFLSRFLFGTKPRQQKPSQVTTFSNYYFITFRKIVGEFQSLFFKFQDLFYAIVKSTKLLGRNKLQRIFRCSVYSYLIMNMRTCRCSCCSHKSYNLTLFNRLTFFYNNLTAMRIQC